ncbi:N-alpha-acetyltransferase 16, NatA auxiliary subunit [Entophlyctis luteolus]|nr:N-alpha-acetyltransferase 16, NatA auxiliary subunit [Entophlyctis luteolus]
MAKKVELPAKEAALMRQIAKLHDNKQHKKVFKDGTEALAMKALFLSGLDRREEAHEVIAKAVNIDGGNHETGWHAYGLIYRAEKNYGEVIKCYARALAIDKENLAIFRDFASMQVQLRDMEAYLEACLQIVLLRPSVKLFWLSVAVAFHLSKNIDGAIQTLKIYEELFSLTAERGMDYENSEIIMYIAMLQEENGDLHGALNTLESKEKLIFDKKSLRETKARLHLTLGEMKQAEIAYKALFKMNPDNYAALEGLQKSKNLLENSPALFELFEDLIDQHRRSNALKRIPLNYATGDRFKHMVDHFLRFNFQKGVPSLFVSLRALYENDSKRVVIEELCLSYVQNLTVNSVFGEPNSGSTDDEDEIRVVEPPSAILWVYYFLAQHYDYLKIREKALEYVELAINHTPTLVELFMTKARILKVGSHCPLLVKYIFANIQHAGDVKQAMEVMNHARCLDLQDRCINTKCVKYMLRAGSIEEAEKTVILFCRVDSTEKLQDLVDMQCSWFAYESAMAHIANGDYGRALKKFHQVDKFDFHTYSVRKATLRTYIDLVRVEDRLWAHQFYFNSAVEAVRLYLSLYDSRSEVQEKKKEEDTSKMSESDRKKALRKARKAELKGGSEPTEAKGSPAGSAASGTSGGGGKKKDDDPDGSKLLNEQDLLGASLKFLKRLLEGSPNRVEPHILGCGVYMRRKNFLLAVKSLKRGFQIDPANPELHVLAIELSIAVKSASGELNEKIRSVLLDVLKSIVKDDLAVFNRKFAELPECQQSLSHAISVVQGCALVDPDHFETAVEGAIAAVPSSRNIKDVISAHKTLVKLNATSSQLGQFVKSAVKLFPLSNYFLTA